MSVKVPMPNVGESITSGFVSAWLKNVGDTVEVDEPFVSIETDKATVDVPSPVAGRLVAQLVNVNDEVPIGAPLAEIEEGAAEAAPAQKTPEKAPEKAAEKAPEKAAEKAAEPQSGPAARRIAGESGVDLAKVQGTGPGGRILKEDVQPQAAPRPAPAAAPAPKAAPVPSPVPAGERAESLVPMTPLRRRVAERLVEAQHTAAILTTFNEVDMSRVMELRAQVQDEFTKKHGTKLGFMSFFVRASIDALRAFPMVNAEIRDTNIVYRNFFDIGVAVGGGKGLVVPVIRNAERLSFADIEKTIADFGARARDNKLKLEELQGGTFTISNGGIYGSLMSTPILNPPQSGILGMHKIEKRAVVVDDQIVVRPMMYLALSYDHRLVDGREAVSFLVRVKDCLERPERLLFDL